MESGLPVHNHHHAAHRETFQGHVAPGSALILMGCLWAYNSLFRYHVARRQAVLKGIDTKKLRYRNMLFSHYHSGWTAPVEAIFVILITCSISLVEIATLYFHASATVVLQHLLMFFFFALMGIIKVLQHYKFTMPPSSEYVAFILANAVMAFLLPNHLFGRAIVDRQMHMILVELNAIIIACTAAEIMYNRSVTAALGRTLFFVAQGIWLWVLAVVIHPLPFMHKWDLDDHVVLDVVSSLAIAVVVIALLIAFAMNIIISKRVKTMNLATVNRIVALTHYRRKPSEYQGEAARPLISNSEYGV